MEHIMSIKFTRYQFQFDVENNNTFSNFAMPRASSNDIAILEKLSQDSAEHSSGGSYNMLARWIKGSRVVTGKNRLDRPASTMNDDYPDICGVHAELDLFYRLPPIKGGTLYIAGSRAKTGAKMPNTSPCIYCHTIIRETNVRYIVYYNEGKAIKMPIVKYYNYSYF